MIYSDYHIHSKFSPDSREDLENIVKRAIELGLKEIAITDHYDVNSPMEPMGFVLDIPEYFKRISKLKAKYAEKIHIKIGIELGVQPEIHNILDEIVENWEWDFVLASQHTVDKFDVSLSEYFRGKNKYQAHRRYFEALLETVKNFKNYSVLSHLDFISRYGGEQFRNLELDEVGDVIDEILSIVIADGKGIEINTSGFRYGENRTYPSFNILRRYFNLGGKTLVIGSDAHRSEDIAKDFEKVYSFLIESGINEISGFDKMREYKVRI